MLWTVRTLFVQCKPEIKIRQLTATVAIFLLKQRTG